MIYVLDGWNPSHQLVNCISIALLCSIIARLMADADRPLVAGQMYRDQMDVASPVAGIKHRHSPADLMMYIFITLKVVVIIGLMIVSRCEMTFAIHVNVIILVLTVIFAFLLQRIDLTSLSEISADDNFAGTTENEQE